MNLLTAENLSKTYGDRVLFANLSFGIDEGDKIGLIGVNGSGKTTLLKVLAGLEGPDQGKISLGNTARLEYLPQDPEFEDGITVLQQVFKGHSPLMQLLRDYEAALTQLSANPEDPAWQQRLLQLGQKMDVFNAWQLESDAKIILTKLGISKFDSLVGSLSGGQRKRVALASALINPADLLILDEPTNHIDPDTVAWLEQYLSKLKGAVLMVTHDRYFLDRVAQRILELDQGNLYSYPGNYTRFLELKTERETQAEASERKRQSRLRTELEWIRRGARARTTKQKARIDRFEQLEAEKVPLKTGQVDMAAGAARLGKKVLECSHLYKAFPKSGTVIRDFSYLLDRNDRIGIIGPNGSGKSTLLNLLAARLSPDSGSIEKGPTVNLGYFAQENTEMKPTLKVIEYIKEVAEVLPTPDGGLITASQMLERFLFPPSLQWTPIAKLSGGEKRRLYLLRILMGAPNVLLFDEPTNDLDLETLTVLEEYLDSFPGAVLAVSHDRYFLDRIAAKIFAFVGDGAIRIATGNYSDYEAKASTQPVVSGDRDQPQAQENTAEQHEPRKQERTLKMSFNEQREYEQIEEQIAQTEMELSSIHQEMNQANSDFSKLQELANAQQALEQKLDSMIERWAYLNELAERIANSHNTH